jgi:hypothetical protein
VDHAEGGGVNFLDVRVAARIEVGEIDEARFGFAAMKAGDGGCGKESSCCAVIFPVLRFTTERR